MLIDYKKLNYQVPTLLCSIMGKYKSDKGNINISTSHHNYTIIYNQLFDSMKNNQLNIFELGLGTTNQTLPSHVLPNGLPGASHYGWEEYFTNSNIYGADIDRNILFNKNRIHTFYCDQTNPSSIKNLWANKGLSENMDIIIEDGLHEIDANICFFENSIHKLNVNGYYIIEDIHKHDFMKFNNKIREWVQKYPNIEFQLLEIPGQNKSDNNMLLCKKIAV